MEKLFLVVRYVVRLRFTILAGMEEKKNQHFHTLYYIVWLLVATISYMHQNSNVLSFSFYDLISLCFGLVWFGVRFRLFIFIFIFIEGGSGGGGVNGIFVLMPRDINVNK